MRNSSGSGGCNGGGGRSGSSDGGGNCSDKQCLLSMNSVAVHG